MSSLLLSDLCLSLLLLLQFYSISLTAFLLVLLLPPFIAFFAAAAGLNALFTHVPRRAASLARYYNLWNGTSMWNVVSATWQILSCCGFKAGSFSWAVLDDQDRRG